MTRAIFISRRGGPEALELREVPDPEPGPGQIRLRVRAAGVNFADLLMRQGLYPGAPPLPFVPGYEVAGEVETAGPGVLSPLPGARVFAAVDFGGYAERIIIDASHVLPIPQGGSFEEAAALPVNYLTAYHALYVLGNLRPGSRVLIHAAAGGVGVAATQLALLRQAEVIGTASASKYGFLKEQGVHHVVDYRTEDFEERVKSLTGGRGVHVALDAVGGKSFRKSYRCLAPTGLLVCFGTSAAATGPSRSWLRAARTYLTSGLFSPLELMMSNRGVVGLHLGRLTGETGLLKEELSELHKLWLSGKIRPCIDREFPPEKAAEAHRRLQERKNAGKVVLTFPD